MPCAQHTFKKLYTPFVKSVDPDHWASTTSCIHIMSLTACKNPKSDRKACAYTNRNRDIFNNKKRFCPKSAEIQAMPLSPLLPTFSFMLFCCLLIFQEYPQSVNFLYIVLPAYNHCKQFGTRRGLTKCWHS